MSYYRYKSGAEKRREHDDRMRESKEGERTLFEVEIGIAPQSMPESLESQAISTCTGDNVDNRSFLCEASIVMDV